MRKIEKKMSISTRLTLFYSSVLILTMVIGSTITFLGLNFVFINQAELQINSAYNSVANFIKEGGQIGQQIIKDTPFAEGIVIKIYDEQEVMILDTGFKTPYYDIDEDSNKVLVFQNINNYVMYRNYNLMQGDVNYKIQIIKSMQEYNKFTKVLFGILIILLVLGLGVSIIIGKMISKKMIKPVEDVTKTAKRITAEDLNERLPISGPDDEIRELSMTFNDMLDRLTEHIDHQKRFVSDASHELKTPISVIKGYIELLDMYGSQDKSLLDESIESIRLETENMTKLIEQLLYLAKRDSQIEQFDMEEFDLKALVNEVYQESCLIDEQRHDIKLDSNESVSIYGSKTGIKQMMRILIDNSRKFTPEEGEILISVKRQGGKALLSIEDSGMGISEDDLPHIFERFYCADKSRNKAKAGSGLGLAIAKSIIEEHKGSIVVSSKINIGTIIKILL